MTLFEKNIVIITKHNNWFCKKCGIAHGALYIGEKLERYCPLCTPGELKKKVIKVKQNGDLVE